MGKNIEIERKFLVKGAFKNLAVEKRVLKQGYLSTDPERTVRVRMNDNKGFITIKGISNETGMSRFEWEKEIDAAEANELLALCEKPLIEKSRHIIKHGKHIFEVDEFYGDNQGLILAEIELWNEDEKIAVPDFIGEEVTNDPRYYNSYLSKHPFNKWEIA